MLTPKGNPDEIRVIIVERKSLAGELRAAMITIIAGVLTAVLIKLVS
jgi:hypothetical protein